MPETTSKKYSPEFEVSENFSMGVVDTRMGSSINAIVNFEVVERTKSYTVLRIHYLFPVKSKRAL